MKVSIITVCLNSESTIRHTLNSVISQNYKNIEHILVDGGSEDKTVEIIKNYKFSKKKIFLLKNKSLYNSINYAIKKSKGDLISILHSDDIYDNNFVIDKVVNISKKSKSKIFFGDVVYFNKLNFYKAIRFYPAKNTTRKIFTYGNMPPHTGSFYKKDIFKKYGLYNGNFKIAGDFEHLFRLIYVNKLKFKTLGFVVTRMRTGGLSGRNLNSFLTINKEILKTFKIYNYKTSIYKILLRIPPKILQYMFLDQIELNKNFKLTINKVFEDKIYNKINILQDIKKLNFKKNFILSALNLAFIGSLSRNHVKLNKNLINWPDGIFSKLYKKKLRKIPGRQIIKDIQIDKNVKRVLILGNLTTRSKKYLKNKFKVKIIHKELPFGNTKIIIKKLNFKIKKTDLIFLTLPTPKQEQIAEFMQSKNKYYKIICIGGSIGIVSGDEKEVPKFLFYFEFLWRLRYETVRRLRRLFITFYQYITDIIIFKRLNNVQIKMIE